VHSATASDQHVRKNERRRNLMVRSMPRNCPIEIGPA
jgi:hypothetical protein